MTNGNKKYKNYGDLHPSDELLHQIGIQQIISIFDIVPELLFWIKDVNSRILYVNEPLRSHLGISSTEKVVGLTDYDFAPKHVAKQFITDDKKVMNGAIIVNRLEMNVNHKGESAWYITSKKPLYDDNNDIVGTYGISRQLEQLTDPLPEIEAIKVPVDYIKKHYMHDINITELAQSAHMSVSTLERRFKKCINKTPRQFINEVRLENARRLLIETNLPISVISSKSGFADHSYFSRKFAEMFDDIPSAFRMGYHDKGTS